MKSKFLGHSANDLFWFILPLVLPLLLVRYNLSYAQAGSILTLYLGITALGSVLIGKLSDRFSRKTILVAGFLAAALGLTAAGFAPTLLLFLILISLTALAVSTFHPVMYAILDENYPENKGRVMSLYEICGSGAILLMFLVNGFLLERIGVRGVLIVTAIPALLMGLHYAFSDAVPSSLHTGTDAAESGVPVSRHDLFRYILFLTGIILRVISVGAVLNFLPVILVNFLDFSSTMASYGTAFFFVGGIAGSLVAGKLSVCCSPLKALAVSIVMVIPFLMSFILPLPFWGHVLGIMGFGFFGSGCIVYQNMLMTGFSRHLGKGEAFGIMMGALTIGSAVSPALLGASLDFCGFVPSLLLFTIPLFLSGGLLFYLVKSERFVPAGESLSSS